jgi:hypothetical protein
VKDTIITLKLDGADFELTLTEVYALRDKLNEILAAAPGWSYMISIPPQNLLLGVLN